MKLDAFESRSLDSAGYRAAVKRCRRVNRRAFKRWQATLRVRIHEMGNSDANFWKLTKEIGGLEPSRSAAAPPVDEVAAHLQSKMSNGRDLDDVKPLKIPDRLLLKSWKICYRSVLSRGWMYPRLDGSAIALCSFGSVLSSLHLLSLGCSNSL